MRLVIFALLSLISFNGKTRDVQQISTSKRSKECFDLNWMFHKGDI
jgi:hypothetical protein